MKDKNFTQISVGKRLYDKLVKIREDTGLSFNRIIEFALDKTKIDVKLTHPGQ